MIAAINIDDNGGTLTAWNDNINLIANVDATDIQALVPSPIIELTSSSALYAGSTFAGIGNPANWSGTTAGINYANPNIGGTTFASQDATIECYFEGTLIATPQGERKVEDLVIGDEVLTASGKAVSVKWMGYQTVGERRVSERTHPVRLRAGSLGAGVPHSDLTVSAAHEMIVDGMVINASALVNGDTIDFVPLAELPATFTYYHVETQDHDVILANGAEAETFVDYVGRSAFDNAAEYIDLYGAERIIPEMDRTRVSSRRLVPAKIKAKLAVSNEVFDFDMGRSA